MRRNWCIYTNIGVYILYSFILLPSSFRYNGVAGTRCELRGEEGDEGGESGEESGEESAEGTVKGGAMGGATRRKGGKGAGRGNKTKAAELYQKAVDLGDGTAAYR
jgi:hypothetical protein